MPNINIVCVCLQDFCYCLKQQLINSGDHCNWSSSVVVRRMPCVNSFIFLTSSWKLQDRLVACLVWSISMIRGISILNIMAPHSWGATGGAKYEKKTKCIVMMSMKPTPKIFKSMAPGLRLQALGWGQYTPYSENIINLRKYSSALYKHVGKNWMHSYNVHKLLYLNCKKSISMTSDRKRGRAVWAYMFIHIMLKNILFSNLTHLLGKLTS